MGRASREKPTRLAEKLLQIRNAMDLSQNGMLRKLGIDQASYRNYISDFENGVREPSLPVLLKYAKAAGVYVVVPEKFRSVDGLGCYAEKSRCKIARF